jgi:hypothetical protein
VRLKILTTALVIFALGLMVSWSFIIGEKPTEKEALAQWAVRLGFYVMTILISFVGAAIGAVVLSRRAREEYRAQAEANMRELIEGTLSDHKTKQDPQQ